MLPQKHGAPPRCISLTGPLDHVDPANELTTLATQRWRRPEQLTCMYTIGSFTVVHTHQKMDDHLFFKRKMDDRLMCGGQ